MCCCHRGRGYDLIRHNPLSREAVVQSKGQHTPAWALQERGGCPQRSHVGMQCRRAVHVDAVDENLLPGPHVLGLKLGSRDTVLDSQLKEEARK